MTKEDIERADPTVKQCLAASPAPDGGTYYLIETTFATFPKFVVGHLKADGSAVQLLRCGKDWSAWQFYNSTVNINHQPALGRQDCLPHPQSPSTIDS